MASSTSEGPAASLEHIRLAWIHSLPPIWGAKQGEGGGTVPLPGVRGSRAFCPLRPWPSQIGLPAAFRITDAPRLVVRRAGNSIGTQPGALSLGTGRHQSVLSTCSMHRSASATPVKAVGFAGVMFLFV